MSERIAIVQSNYIPWKGYFHMINSVDKLVILDDVQYTRRDWRNRNLVKSKDGLIWLTIPVYNKHHRSRTIMDTQVADSDWNRKHWETIRHCYKRARYFDVYGDALEELYLNDQPKYLSEINVSFITRICELLSIETPIIWSAGLEKRQGKSQRLVDICKTMGASVYVTGARAKNYLDETIFRQEGICVDYFQYAEYPEYAQLHPPFEHRVSILDVLLNTGANATWHIGDKDCNVHE